MNYKQFIIEKRNILESNPNMKDLSSMNLYETYSFDHKIREVVGHINGNIHRCHLVENWLDVFNFPLSLKSQIGTSTGVRDSLSITLDYFKDKKWIIPQDVYPFYQKLFKDKNMQYDEYKTLIGSELFSDLSSNDSDCLLLTFPLKPLGRNLTNEEILSIKNWLSEKGGRRLFIDSVYLNFSDLTTLSILLDFFSTDKTFIFFSLSKAFLLPKIFGLILIPNRESHIRESFKKLIPKKENLNLAFQALNSEEINDRAYILIDNLEKKNQKLKSYLEDKNIIVPKFNGGYFFYSDQYSYEELLDMNILSIPESVFGGSGSGVIFSSL